MKKTICLITNWYPTKENPYKGLFFKEQAFAVSDYFDFLVIHYVERKRKRHILGNRVHLVNQERNTIEYSVEVNIPLRVCLADVFQDFKVKYINKNPIDGVGKYISSKHKFFSQKRIVKIFKDYFQDKFDALYCVDAQCEAFNLQCIAERFNVPYIVSEHAPVPWPGSVIKDVDKYAIEKADAFLAISNDKIRQLLLQNIKLPETKYIGNLIDEEKFKISEKKNVIKTFVIVAAYSFYKNYDLFISVMNRLTDITDKPFRVMIVGYAANKGYSKNIEELENKIKNSRFADRTEMISSVPHDEIGGILNKADAFVMTSIQEGQPVAAMEAACCGLPIFSTRCGGVEDYVDEKMGRIYAITDYEGMASGLKDYLDGKLEFDSTYIRNRVVSKFGRKAFIKNFTDAFNRVIDIGKS